MGSSSTPGLAADVGGMVSDVVDEVVPSTILDKFTSFYDTLFGRIVLTGLFIVAVILFTMLAVRLVNGFFRRSTQRMLEKNNAGATAFSYLRYLALAAIYFAAVNVIVSSIPPLESGMSRLFAAGGVLAVVLGFASQQAMGSLVSGLMILTFKPFSIGDIVNVVSNGVSGTVEDITLRHTIIRTAENKRAIVPNDTMNSAIIENANHTDEKVCQMLDIAIGYEADIDRAIQIISDEILAHPDFFDHRAIIDPDVDVPSVAVRVRDLEDTGIVLRAALWAEDSTVGFAMRGDLLKSIKQRFDREGIELSYPRIVVMTHNED